MKPPLTWVGGKRWQLPLIQTLFAGHEQCRVVEPFCGSASITFGLAPQRALLNDANPHLINFYRHLQAGLTLDASARDESEYYANRDWFNELVRSGHGESREAAELFFYLNTHCFNSLWRVNAHGEFNVPIRPGTRRSGGARPIEENGRELADYTRVMRDWLLSCASFESLDLEPDDFIYADPPYDDTFDGYTAGGFGWAEQERVARVCSLHPGPVVITNRATERILNLYAAAGFTLLQIDGQQKMHQSCARRGTVPEVVAVNSHVTLPTVSVI